MMIELKLYKIKRIGGIKMILTFQKMEEMIRFLLENYKTYKKDFTVLAYEILDNEGGLSKYKIFLMETEMYIKPQLLHLSGYLQSPTPLFTSEFLKNLYSKEEYEIIDTLLTKKYGEDYDEDHTLDIEVPRRKDYSRELEKNIIRNISELIGEKLLDHMRANNIDNKYYGYRDENGHVNPIDKGVIYVNDVSDNKLMGYWYKEIDTITEIAIKLLYKSLVNVDVKVLEQAYLKAKEINENVLVFDGPTDCNDESEDCSLDFVKIFITPNCEIVEKRTHTY
jgi:hypothetical protein